MKKFLILFSTLLVFSFANFASAEITIKNYMSYDFLDKQGYSGEMLKLLEMSKSKTFGDPFPTYWSANPFKRFCQKTAAYIDPAADYGDFGEHDIIMHSTWRDY